MSELSNILDRRTDLDLSSPENQEQPEDSSSSDEEVLDIRSDHETFEEDDEKQ